MDWPFLLRTAHQHGVMPLLYRSLSTACPEAVPQTVLAQLRARFQTNARRNVLLTKELLKLLNLLEAQRIPTLCLKGPALAASAYGSLSLRQFGDLDILVRQRDVPRETAYLQIYHHYPLVSRDGRVAVELHWRIVSRQCSFSLDPERLWERTERVSLAGTTVRQLSPEDLLLILCVHASKPWHRWGRLAWICDVAELIRVYEGLNWGQVMAQASRLGSERRLLLGLRLSRDLLGTVLPQEVQQRMQADPVVKSLAGQVHEWLFCETEGRSETFDGVMERWQDRARSRLYTLITPTVVKWALWPPVGLLAFPFRLLDRVPTRNVWLWPLPLFALLSYLYHLLLPIRQAAKRGLKRLGHLSYTNQ
jgi:hypothetical protein